VEVALGQRFDDMIEISSSELKEGDKLICEGQAKLINGDKISVKE